jgi:hypothetical protein
MTPLAMILSACALQAKPGLTQANRTKPTLSPSEVLSVYMNLITRVQLDIN